MTDIIAANPSHGVMVNDVGAEMQAAAQEQVGGSTTPLCHGSATSSQEEERLISSYRPSISRRRGMVDDPLVKSKLRVFYAVTAVFIAYSTIYFTYLLLRKR